MKRANKAIKDTDCELKDMFPNKTLEDIKSIGTEWVKGERKSALKHHQKGMLYSKMLGKHDIECY